MDPRLQSIQRALASAPPNPLYVVCGEDELAVRRAAELIEAAVLGQGGVDRDAFDLPEHAIESVIDAASTRPMWSDRRLVSVRAAKGLDADTLRALAQYAGSPAPFSTVVVVTRKLDQRTSFAKALAKAGGMVSLSPPSARELPDWLMAQAREEGFELDGRAARALVDAIGAEPLALKTTLDKVINYVGEQRPLGLADVEAVVVRTRDEVVWDLSDACGAKDLSRALATLHGMLEHGESGIGILAVVARHFRQMWQVKSLLEAGTSVQDVPSKASMHPFVAKKLAGQVRRFDAHRLQHFFRLFFETDRALKSSKLNDRLVLERLMFELCRP